MKATNAYKKYSYPKFGEFMVNTIKKQSENKIFENEWPRMAQLKPICDRYLALMDEIKNNRKPESETLRDDVRTEAHEVLKKNVNAVNGIADGDEAILIASNLPYTKVGSGKAIHLVPVTEYLVKYTSEVGTYNIKFKAQHSMKLVSVFFTTENPFVNEKVTWAREDYFKSSIVFRSGLTSGRVFIKLVLKGSLGDTIETPILEFAVTKIM
ncbi:hypothetical protein [Sphingobacterium hungaricum]|uniref:Uncharacterized protein n=1 Tax=Sphingobacterium hungaricum TaxID=2082723 RepID=A0A928YSF2_9SPHI|nr:hypothetical protein [Sphingobacterium hungaricum]MBE8715200.1 hypothetical protein [Sphingobacterium hungaricum]